MSPFEITFAVIGIGFFMLFAVYAGAEMLGG